MKQSSALILAAALAGAACPALATTNRAIVSGHGTDAAGCGAPTNPCRSLQFAHDHIVNAGGEIDILDTAGYGAVTITKAVAIVNDGAGVAGVQATSGNAITINAGAADAVYLRGLSLDGLGAATDGLSLSSAGRLTMLDCVARRFRGDGVFIEPATGTLSVLIADTVLDDNGNAGIAYFTASGDAVASVVIDHVIATGNGVGINVVTTGGTGASSITISNSIASNSPFGNGADLAGSPATKISVDSSYFDNNGGNGITISGKGQTFLSRSVSDQNALSGVVMLNLTTPGAVFSSGDNHIDGNASGAVTGGPMTSDPNK